MKDQLTAPADGAGYIYRGSDGGRPSFLMQCCRYLLENSTAGEGMLILVRDRDRLDEWNRELAHIYPVEPRICTFRSFVRQELEVYYPLAAAGRAGADRAVLRPVFMDRETAANLVSRVVQHRREKDGIFSALSSTSEKIASDILGSLEAAAMAGIPCGEAFDRLYSSLEIKNEIRMKIYRDAGGIAAAYRSKCMELGVLDSSASIELYCACLLKDETYRPLLRKRYDYLIAESIQEWDEAQLSAAELLLPSLKACALGYDPEAAAGYANRLRRNKYIEDRLFTRCGVVDISENGAEPGELSEVLFRAIAQGRSARASKGPALERHPEEELRGEMLEALGERVGGLVEEGVAPPDIVILSTFADVVTELVLAGILRKRGIGLVNRAAREKASDSRLCRALLAFAGLCHPRYGLFPSRDDVRLLAETLFGLDPVRACTLAAKTCAGLPRMAFPGPERGGLAQIFDEDGLKKYLYAAAWTEAYKKSPEEDMEVFLQKALLELFLDCEKDSSELARAKRLIDRAGEFRGIVSRFGTNAGRDFAGAAGFRAEVGEGLKPAQQDVGKGSVMLTTPAEYLGSGMRSKVTVICGLSSRNWSPARARELVNPNILSAAWEPGRIYTQACEAADRSLYLADIIRAVARRCGERLVTFESRLNASGYENSGLLPEIFDNIQ